MNKDGDFYQVKNLYNKILSLLPVIAIIAAFSGFQGVFAQQAIVQGIITDNSNGLPLEGANVVLEDTDREVRRGMAADRNGFYQITGLDPGRYSMRISYIGFVAYVDTFTVRSDERRTISISMKPDDELLDEVVVAPTGTGAAQLQAGRQRISVSDLRRIPTPAPGGDLASYLQAMPGVVSAGDRGGQLYIRGGTPAENMVLVDGTMIFRPFHIVGFFSVFPADLVTDVDVYAGGFGARHNGRISSLIDVRMRDGDRYQAKGSAAVSPFVGEVVVESPISRGETSMIASFRRSLIEETSPLYPDMQQPVRFESQYLKLTHFGVDDTRCSGMILRTYDRGQLDAEEGDMFRWNNLVVGGRCILLPVRSSMVFDMNAGISHVSNSVGISSNPDRQAKVTRFNLDTNLIRYFGDLRMEYGLYVRIKSYDYFMREQFHAPRAGNRHILSPGTYMEVSIPLVDRLHIRPGASLTFYREAYRPSFQPRMQLAWQPFGRDEEELNASIGYYRQVLSGVTDTRDVGSAFTAWMSSPVGEDQMESLHAVMGWRQSLAPGFHMSMEGYHKWNRNIPVTVWSTIASFSTDLSLAKGTVYGADLRLELNRGAVYAFLGYGFSVTEYEAAQDHFSIWFGEPVQRYYPAHDRRHQVNAQFSIDLGAYTTSLSWQLGTGMPFTRPIGFDELHRFSDQLPEVTEQYGTPRVILDKPFQGRTPLFHRLDFSIERSFDLQFASLNFQIGAINMYDQNNLFYYDVYTHRRINQLPLAPYFSLRLGTN